MLTKMIYRQVTVLDENIFFYDRVKVDKNGEEVFDSNIEKDNEERLYEMYRIQKGYVTVKTLKLFLEDYNISLYVFSKVTGINETKMQRILKGTIQSEFEDFVIQKNMQGIINGDEVILAMLDIYKFAEGNERFAKEVLDD